MQNRVKSNFALPTEPVLPSTMPVLSIACTEGSMWLGGIASLVAFAVHLALLRLSQQRQSKQMDTRPNPTFLPSPNQPSCPPCSGSGALPFPSRPLLGAQTAAGSYSPFVFMQTWLCPESGIGCLLCCKMSFSNQELPTPCPRGDVPRWSGSRARASLLRGARPGLSGACMFMAARC